MELEREEARVERERNRLLSVKKQRDDLRNNNFKTAQTASAASLINNPYDTVDSDPATLADEKDSKDATETPIPQERKRKGSKGGYVEKS